ncbi:hypothetical protein [Alteromonas gilva]|uniref:Uncharacterized protein n=1 Tax=Alteromonas gilva TaxID=2987522 RepID=A0ABT5L7E1_9ALTE|nr:hypothetical protein [Alteromonas gilva]MDC8832985.1 hypothetical protein [Alteromonas gilva]
MFNSGFYKIKIGHDGAGGAGGDEAASFNIDTDSARWFAKAFFTGLKATDSNSGYVTITGAGDSLTLSMKNWREPDFDDLKLPPPLT